ncbi:MAG: cation:proton antiporter, partial [Cyanobacteria bacterium P01_D01_bin.36]
GSVALRLGFLPATCEAIAVAMTAMWLFDFDFFTGLLLGCVVGAESPAVIVPGMLRLKRLGLGVAKGIPDAILLGSALSDVLLLLVFSLLLAFLSQGSVTEGVEGAAAGISLFGVVTLSPLQLLPFQVVIQVGLGIVLGGLSARLLAALLGSGKWTQNQTQDTLVAAACALSLVVIAAQLPLFSGYLAVMAMGFFLIQLNAPLARRLREGFNTLWVVAEIMLFVLLGASIQLSVLEDLLWAGLLLLAIGTFVGRSLGWFLATLGSNWTGRERLFLLPGNSAKATVQAAIGAIPLAQSVQGGDVILAIAALSILVTAPLGAWAIPTFAPRLLERGVVDPTKVAIAHKTTLLAVAETSHTARPVLTKAAELARRNDADVVVLCMVHSNSEQAEQREVDPLKLLIQQNLADIRHRLIVSKDAIPAEVIRVSKEVNASEIIVNKQPSHANQSLVSMTVRSIVEVSSIPVIVVQ